MGNVLNLSSVKDTTLWKRLNSGFVGAPEKDIASELSITVVNLCEMASERIKIFPYFHPQYTLHDQRHLLRVCELIAFILNDELVNLNPIEIALLILAAHFHDQGMVPDAADWNLEMQSPEFKLSRNRWEIEHPNAVEIRRQIGDNRFSDAEKEKLRLSLEELRDAHRSDYLRHTHGNRSEQIVNQLVGAANKLVVAGINLATILGRLCASHVWPAEQLAASNGFRIDQSVGAYTVNIQFLAVLLRLGDILDFDRDRTPDVLLNTINISSPVSLIEWSKHLSVEGWEINSKQIRFTLQCEHPAYQRAAYEFMDAIDQELVQSHRIVSAFPAGTPTHYRLKLPLRVERDRIEPKNGSYRYFDLEFSLSRNEIVKLLMTEELYQSDSLFVRELLQNSLDALRFRQAIYGKGRPNWDEGKVLFEHFINDAGFQVVRCVDNGVGMDADIIKRFLTKAGRSYYRSPEFEVQRIGFRNNEVDFDPCAQFGIGFMSCFMFGDHIRVLTRRDYGPGRDYGDPLDVEVNGLGGLLVIREGKQDQPVGTTVEIIGPRRPSFIDEWEDIVRLCDHIKGYALATEFLIRAQTSIEEIRECVEVKPIIAERQTLVEKLGLKNTLILRQEFKEIHPELAGCIRCGLLVDEKGSPVIENTEAQLVFMESSRSNTTYKGIHLKAKSSGVDPEPVQSGVESAVCLDGIFVCGQPGRGESLNIGYPGNNLRLGDPYILDIRGKIKPRLSPARTPPSRMSTSDRDSSWLLIKRQIDAAHAKMWETVTERLRNDLSAETFWKLTLLHGVPIHLMNAQLLWNVPIPVLNGDSQEWLKMSEIGFLSLSIESIDGRKEVVMMANGERKIGVCGGLKLWLRGQTDWSRYLEHALLRFTLVQIEGNSSKLVLRKPESSKLPEFDDGLSVENFYKIWPFPFFCDAADLLAIESPLLMVNRNHPIVQHAKTIINIERADRDDFDLFCENLVVILAHSINLNNIAEGKDTKGRHLRCIGCIYRSLNWERYDQKYKPPYKVWTQSKGIFEITTDHLMRWGNVPDE